MICKIKDNELVTCHTSVDRSCSVTIADYETPTGKVIIQTKAHRTFFLIEYFGQRVFILSEDAVETLKTLHYLKQCGLSKGDCQ